MKETTNEKNAHKNLTYSKRHKEEYLNIAATTTILTTLTTTTNNDDHNK